MKLSNLYILVVTLIVSILLIAGVLKYLGYFAYNNNPSPNKQIDLNSTNSDNESENKVENADHGYALDVVIDKLYVPWSIVFTSDSRMLFTERNGLLRSFENNELKTIHKFEEVKPNGEEGLMGLALDTQYLSNKFIYVCFAYPTSDKSTGGFYDKVVRYIDNGSSLSGDRVLIDKIPAASNHAGCRLRFGPDQKLYITTGDATNKANAQDKESLSGKILRINSDGTLPTDNPYANSPVWSLGHRNPQGIDFHPLTGDLFESEHGPSGFDGPGGGDEINIIKRGQNYGWPIVSHDRSQEGLVSPLLVFTPAIAPASGMFYRGDVFNEFKNNFFVGLLRGEGILRVVLDEKDITKVISNEKLKIAEGVGRIRDVVEGPDGNIYFSTSNRDGRGTLRENDDKIYRIRIE